MVKIRLFRTGTVKRPLYRIVAIDERARRQSRSLEALGTYDPRGGGKVELNDAAVKKWLDQGARASDTVASILRRRKVSLQQGEGASPATPA
jgi:small subunit ribosomal protein S16